MSPVDITRDLHRLAERVDALERGAGEQLSPNYLSIAPDGTITPLIQFGGAAGGDLAGTYPNPTIPRVAFACPARVYLSNDAATGAAGGAWVDCPYDSIDFDPQACIVGAPGSYAYQVPASGIYHFTAQAQIETLGSLQPQYAINLTRSGGQIRQGAQTFNFSTDPDIVISGDVGLVESDLLHLSAGDTLLPQVFIHYNTTFRGSFAVVNYFSVYRVA